MTIKVLALGNDWPISLTLTDSAGVGVTGLTVRGFLAATKDGLVAIDPTLEIAALTGAAGGVYTGVLDAVVLSAALANYPDSTIYERHVVVGAYNGYSPVWVMAARAETPA